MEVKNKLILITGSAGFIGSHLTERLVLEGAKVRGMIHYNSRNDWGLLEQLPKDILDEVEVIAGCVQDPFSVKKAVKGCELVFHLAALIAIPYSYIAPQSYVTTNVLGTLNVMQACLEEGVQKVVHTSTSETYGTAQYVPIDERHPLQAQSPYSASKIAADKVAESYHLSFGLPVTIIRPFNTYGPRQSARAVIPTVVSQVLRGDSLRIGSLHTKRDLNYVDDIVNGFLQAGVSENIVGEVINIGSGVDITIKEVVHKIMKMTGKNVEIISENERVRPEKSEVERLLADNTKAKRLLGWQPRVSLDEGLQKTIQWFSQNLHHYKSKIYNI
jgi:NAD dependent epimerase/dehydratase